MSAYQIIKPKMGEITSAIMSALAEVGVDCGYDFKFSLHQNYLMLSDSGWAANEVSQIVPHTVAKQNATGEESKL